MFSRLLLLAVALARVEALVDCVCYSRQKNDSDVVCNDPYLTNIPVCVPESVKVLSISTPSIPLVAETLKNYSKLVIINIEHFEHPAIEDNFLEGKPNLRFFQIYNTSIGYIKSQWFSFTPNLTVLNIMDSKVYHVPKNLLKKLPKLTELNLSGNRLTTLHRDLLINSAVKVLYLDRNPWECGCTLFKFVDLASKTKARIYDDPRCAFPPHLEGISIRSVPTHLACQWKRDLVDYSMYAGF